MRKKKHPKFNVPNSTGKKKKIRVKARWRKPRGVDNKKRIRKKSFGASPRVGYKNNKKIRGLHPSKLEEVMISNVNEVQLINRKDVVLRIRKSVGKRKRLEIFQEAKKMNLRVLNAPKEDNKVKQNVK